MGVGVGGDDRLVERLRGRQERNLIDGDHHLADSPLGQPGGAFDDPLLIGVDLAGRAGDPRERGQLLDGLPLGLPAAAAIERLIQPVQHLEERLEHERGHLQRPGDHQGQLTVELDAQRLGQDFGELQHQQREDQRENPDPLVAEELVELGPGHGGADGVRGRVDRENDGDRALDLLLEARPDGADARMVHRQLGDLSGRDAQQGGLHERAEKRHAECEQDGAEK